MAHYHHERNHQGLGYRLIESAGRVQAEGRIRRRARLGGRDCSRQAARTGRAPRPVASCGVGSPLPLDAPPVSAPTPGVQPEHTSWRVGPELGARCPSGDHAGELSRAGSFVNLTGVSLMGRILRRQFTTIASEAAVSGADAALACGGAKGAATRLPSPLWPVFHARAVGIRDRTALVEPSALIKKSSLLTRVRPQGEVRRVEDVYAEKPIAVPSDDHIALWRPEAALRLFLPVVTRVTAPVSKASE